MENSILKSTKKVVGLQEDYTAFDLDVITHINSVFSTLSQLGIGPEGGFSIEDDAPEWADLEIPDEYLAMVKTYVFLKVRMLFDPPTTSYLIEALEKQIKEHEWRLSSFREGAIPLPIVVLEVEVL